MLEQGFNEENCRIIPEEEFELEDFEENFDEEDEGAEDTKEFITGALTALSYLKMVSEMPLDQVKKTFNDAVSSRDLYTFDSFVKFLEIVEEHTFFCGDIVVIKDEKYVVVEDEADSPTIKVMDHHFKQHTVSRFDAVIAE